jgi:G:T-mismatch repair DNA endonuclease (very short patch repair protein)
MNQVQKTGLPFSLMGVSASTQDCKYAYTPKTRVEFGKRNLKQTFERDKKCINARAYENGYQVLANLECTIRRMKADEHIEKT